MLQSRLSAQYHDWLLASQSLVRVSDIIMAAEWILSGRSKEPWVGFNASLKSATRESNVENLRVVSLLSSTR